MKSNVNKIGLGFVVVFILICIALYWHHAVYVSPVQACEERGQWWDDRDHVCAVPVPLSTITGRRIGPPPPAAQAAPAQSPTKR
jgi:hypothetical protein